MNKSKEILKLLEFKNESLKDNVMDQIEFNDIVFSVSNDGEAYKNRGDKKKVEAAIKKSFQDILKAHKQDADFVLNKNMKILVNNVLSEWE